MAKGDSRYPGRYPGIDVLLSARALQRLKRWLVRLGVPSSDVHDVAQDVLEQLLRTWGNYDAQRSPADRWQNRIAVFTASHYHEKVRRRSREQPGTEPDPEVPDESPTALDLVEDVSQRQHARALIQELPPELRDVLTRYLVGMPMDEIATQLSLPVSTAYKRLTRACDELRRLCRMAEATASQALSPETPGPGRARRVREKG
ncbi:RNA polymerase sigma factor [Sorangium sp. So ce1024]|uniref:RNA polymerase sigma factor n=1 Tax=Sorangium sp. So ce1024 TaxID=3133327 RepID=UPI003F0BB042